MPVPVELLGPTDRAWKLSLSEEGIQVPCHKIRGSEEEWLFPSEALWESKRFTGRGCLGNVHSEVQSLLSQHKAINKGLKREAWAAGEARLLRGWARPWAAACAFWWQSKQASVCVALHPRTYFGANLKFIHMPLVWIKGWDKSSFKKAEWQGNRSGWQGTLWAL